MTDERLGVPRGSYSSPENHTLVFGNVPFLSESEGLLSAISPTGIRVCSHQRAPEYRSSGGKHKKATRSIPSRQTYLQPFK